MSADVRLRQGTLMFGNVAGSFGFPGGGPGAGLHPGSSDPVAGLSFDPPLATVSTQRGTGLFPLLTTRPNRSASSDCSITFACARVVPSGTLATMSNKSELTQPCPPEIASSETP